MTDLTAPRGPGRRDGRWLPFILLLFYACACAEAGPFTEEQEEPEEASTGSAPSATNTASGGEAASEGEGASGGGEVPAEFLGSGCKPPDTSKTALAAEALDLNWPVRPELYRWLSEEEAARFRSGVPVGAAASVAVGVTPTAAHLLGGLQSVAERMPESLEALIADGFQEVHSAWAAAWATRLDAPEATNASNLLHITLREDAWVGELREDGVLSRVSTLAGQEIETSQVRTSPERLVALIHTHWDASRPCDDPNTPNYRELLVRGSEEFVSFELGTESVRQRVEQDARHLEEYLQTTRSCPPSNPSAYRDLACMALATREPYLVTLGHPKEAYRPTAAHIADLIGLLRKDVAGPVNPDESP